MRVSERGGREGDSFASPGIQRERIEEICQREGITLLRVLDETGDVSGGRELHRRPGLGPAVEAIEAREAEVIVGAYFDRLFRSLKVQAEVIDRVESAGGRVLAVDIGTVSNASAAQWLSGTLIGAVSEYFRRSAKERSAEGQRRAIERGIPTYAPPPGYRRKQLGFDSKGTPVFGPLEPSEHADIVREAFRMRAAGATIADVRASLAAADIDRSYRGVSWMLSCRVYLGELNFGKIVNLSAHEPLVDHDTFRRVQDVRVPRGRHAKADRLLARLDVLRCGGCDGVMVAGLQRQGEKVYPLYRCGRPKEDCSGRVTISAPLVEALVVERVRAALAGRQGIGSAGNDFAAAQAAYELAESALNAAVRAFTGLEDLSSAREKLQALRAERDAAKDRADALSRRRAALTIDADVDWDLLSIDGQRALIQAIVESVTIGRGRGAGRVKIRMLGQ